MGWAQMAILQNCIGREKPAPLSSSEVLCWADNSTRYEIDTRPVNRKLNVRVYKDDSTFISLLNVIHHFGEVISVSDS